MMKRMIVNLFIDITDEMMDKKLERKNNGS